MTENVPTSELARPPLELPEFPYDTLLRNAAEHTPDHPAIIFHDEIFTYKDVISLVNRFANALRTLGISKGDRICLFTPNRPEYSITLNAASTIGATVTPMNPAYKEREISYQLSDSEASVLVLYQELVPLLANALQQTNLPHLRHIIIIGGDENVAEQVPHALSFDLLVHEASAERPAPVHIDIDELFILPYSSGTTGLPKGVMLSHRNMVANCVQTIDAMGVEPIDVTLIFLPMYHIYGVMLTGVFLAAGATQVLLERFDPVKALDLCEKYSVTWFFAVPPIVLLLSNWPDLSKLKTVKHLMSGAAPLPIEPARKLQQRLGLDSIIQGYGMTESSPVTHLSPKNPTRVSLENVGIVAANTEQKIVDIETGIHELPLGEDGEVIVRGPQIMLGYWNAPEETARTLRNGWLHTGDIGHLDANGYLYLADRKKEMIKYKGFSIAPAQVEAILLEHPAVQDAAVIGVEDDEAGEVPKGFVVIRPGQQVSEEALIDFVNDKLASYKKLHYIEFIDVIPKVPSGKILRRELRARERLKRGQ